MTDDPDEATGTEAEAEAKEGPRAKPLLTEEEIAFLLAPPDGGVDASNAMERRGERNARSNRTRTERRRADPVFAQRLRDADRERQRRRRARVAVAVAESRPSMPTDKAPNLPALSAEAALRRLEAYALGDSGARAAPDLLRRYVTTFLVYRALAADGGRPTLGAIASLMGDRYGISITRAQAQRLRRQVETFLAPGGPWCDGDHDR